MTAERLRYRRATPADSRACHDLMWTSVVDLGTRQGSPLQGTADEWWRSGESLHRLLAQLAAEWWVAEETDSGRPVGFARTIEREGLVELTEFFVLPDAQGRAWDGRCWSERSPLVQARCAPAFALDLPKEIMQMLTSGETRSARREAAGRARAHIRAPVARTQRTPVREDNDHVPADDRVGYARQAREVRERLLSLRHRHRLVLSRVTQLDIALDRFLDALRWYEEAVIGKDSPWAHDVRATRFFVQPIGDATVGLWEACADLLFEARLLPP